MRGRRKAVQEELEAFEEWVHTKRLGNARVDVPEAVISSILARPSLYLLVLVTVGISTLNSCRHPWKFWLTYTSFKHRLVPS